MKKFIVTLFSLLFMATSVLAEDINVAFTIDNNYPIYTLLAINSILQNNKSNSHYNFYIIENNVTDKNKKRMTDYVEKREQSIKFINIDTDEIDGGNYLFAFSSGGITSIAMARIMLADLLPKDVHKVIYLDGDIVVTEDLKNLYDIDLAGKPAGMSDNNYIFKKLNIYKLDNGYYNSGVILMDLDVWRKEKISEKMVNFVKHNLDKFLLEEGVYNSNALVFADQDLINLILNGRIKRLPQKWNNQTLKGKSLSDLYGGGIIHYIGDVKPWDYPLKRNKAVKIYHKYWNTSGLIVYKFYFAFDVIKDRYKQLCINKAINFLKFDFFLHKLIKKGN